MEPKQPQEQDQQPRLATAEERYLNTLKGRPRTLEQAKAQHLRVQEARRQQMEAQAVKDKSQAKPETVADASD